MCIHSKFCVKVFETRTNIQLSWVLPFSVPDNGVSSAYIQPQHALATLVVSRTCGLLEYTVRSQLWKNPYMVMHVMAHLLYCSIRGSAANKRIPRERHGHAETHQPCPYTSP